MRDRSTISGSDRYGTAGPQELAVAAPTRGARERRRLAAMHRRRAPSRPHGRARRCCTSSSASGRSRGRRALRGVRCYSRGAARRHRRRPGRRRLFAHVVSAAARVRLRVIADVLDARRRRLRDVDETLALARRLVADRSTPLARRVARRSRRRCGAAGDRCVIAALAALVWGLASRGRRQRRGAAAALAWRRAAR